MYKIIFLCLSIIVIGVYNIVCQETKTIEKKIGGSSTTIVSYTEIPAATEPCAPAECEWWNQLRLAANDFQRKGNEKSKRKFITLFVEGLENSYRIPLHDHPSQALGSVSPAKLKPGVRPKNGKVELLVELRSDGSVGEIKVKESLRFDMDELCIQAQRNNIFLPSVKDKSFFTEWQKAECRFWSSNGVK